MKNTAKLGLSGGLLLLLAACAAVKTAVDFKKPNVQVTGANLTGLNFDGAQLDLLLDIENPNPAGFTLQGFDYQFSVEGSQVLAGQQRKQLSIDAAKHSAVPLPVSMKFADIYKVMSSLAQREEMPYDLNATVYLDLPVLGVQPFPVKHKGTLPLPKLPQVRLVDLKIGQLSLTGASADVVLEVSNPNSFGLDIQKLSYQLGLNGHPGVKAALTQAQQVAGKKNAQIRVPVQIDFDQAGQAFMAALNGQSPEFSLAGSMDVNGAIPAMQNVPVFFAQEGPLP
jgi:LEA14-like dessication related protein